LGEEKEKSLHKRRLEYRGEQCAFYHRLGKKRSTFESETPLKKRRVRGRKGCHTLLLGRGWIEESAAEKRQPRIYGRNQLPEK